MRKLYFILKSPLIISMVSVAIGELAVVVILGNLLFYFIEKDNRLLEVIGIKKLLNE